MADVWAEVVEPQYNWALDGGRVEVIVNWLSSSSRQFTGETRGYVLPYSKVGRVEPGGKTYVVPSAKAGSVGLRGTFGKPGPKWPAFWWVDFDVEHDSSGVTTTTLKASFFGTELIRVLDKPEVWSDDLYFQGWVVR